MEITNFAQLYNLDDSLLFNVIMDSDSYKTSHWMQYPPGTEYVYSYLESRGGMFDRTVMYGLQYDLKRYLEGIVITHEMIDVAKYIIVNHMGGDPTLFNEKGWRYIVDFHGGRLPLLIKAIPEGFRINTHNALVTVVNTDPKCYWLVNYMETMLLRVWYSITVATLSAEIKDIIREYLELSGDPSTLESKLVFMLQDFGSRGSTSRESAAIGSSAHMVNFKGSDTMIGLSILLRYYAPKGMPAFSVPAAEHSTITSWGRENESKAYRNMLEKYPTGIVSIVSDSYDILNACGNIFGKELKAEISGRNGTVVIRPDSGEIIPTVLKCLEILESRFGSTNNDKGYKVLPSFVRLLQGDGMNIHTLRSLCRAITDAGWSLDNIACFGMGGKLLQGVDRDTLKFAFKCSAIYIDGEWLPVSKNPVGDATKASKEGIHTVFYRNGSDNQFYTISNLNQDPFDLDIFGDRLVPVFMNGKMMKTYIFDEIRENVSGKNYGRPIAMGSLKEIGKDN